MIFLDIDGVLNYHNYNTIAQSTTIERDCVNNLNYVLEKTNSDIVISSAWRYMVIGGAMTLKGFEYLLRTHGIYCVDRLVGITRPDTEGIKNERGQQIADYLKTINWDKPYLVIDDGGHIDPLDSLSLWTDLGIKEHAHPVIWTNSKTGLTRAQAELAVTLLTKGKQ